MKISQTNGYTNGSREFTFLEDERNSNHVSIELTNLNKLLASSMNKKLLRTLPYAPKNCIYRVPTTLRRLNEKSYDPNVVSIGPLHHGQDRLLHMEKMKLWYLNCLLERLPLPPVEGLELLVQSVREQSDSAIHYYAEKGDLTEDEFIEMMVVDGCFLIELFRRDSWLIPRDKSDPIFNTCWMHENLYHDLILLENQIPWCVLQNLFYLTISVHEQEEDFLIKLVLKFFETMMLMTVPAQFKSRGREVKHILDLLRTSFLFSFEDYCPTNTNWELFPSVTDLLRAGVKFKKGNPDDILHIKFSNGVFEIPPIKIRGNSESLFRNLIAYEQCDRDCTDKFTSYAVFLDCLINTSRDAALLCDKRIVAHALSIEDVSHLFNGLYSDTLVYDFYYGGLSRKVNEYYRSEWPRWRATLKRDYFNNPWSIASFIAAILVLAFTFTQTLFSIISPRGL